MRDGLKPIALSCGTKPVMFEEKALSSLAFDKGYPNNGHGLYIEKTWYHLECCCMKQKQSHLTEQEAVDAWNRIAGEQEAPHA